jgi:hypothetical protein
VTGDIGAAYMGLQVLEREKHFQVNPNSQPDLDIYLPDRTSIKTRSTQGYSYFAARFGNQTT